MACARLLADQHEAQPARLANAMVPATMLELLEGGPSAMDRARQALEHAISLGEAARGPEGDRKSTRLNSSHSQISYAVFCLKKKTDHGRLGLRRASQAAP